jgi:hypothetical protein
MTPEEKTREADSDSDSYELYLMKSTSAAASHGEKQGTASET